MLHMLRLVWEGEKRRLPLPACNVLLAHQDFGEVLWLLRANFCFCLEKGICCCYWLAVKGY